MKLYVHGQGPVRLSQADFVARGGQGTIYAKGTVAFKVYADASQVIPAGKIRQLSRIADSRVIKPERLLSTSAQGPPMGYTMRFVSGGYTLCQLFARSFQRRHGLTPPKVLSLVEQLRDVVEQVHAAGVLVVDLNEMNYLVNSSFDEICAIDVDNYQTPQYPAHAIMATVRDPHCQAGQFTELSDWFSFAVVSFQMLVGIHPFKGKHPHVKTLAERMQRNLSVFEPQVRLPKVCRPFDVIPDGLLAWYRALFTRAERLAPPPAFGRPTAAPARQQLVPSRRLIIDERLSCASTVRAIWDDEGELLVLTDRSIWQGGHRLAKRKLLPPGPVAVGWSRPLRHPVLATEHQGRLQLYDLHHRTRLQTNVAAQQLSTAGGQLYLRNHDQIVRVVLTDVGPTIIASYQPVANVLAHATRLYPGVAVQNLHGAAYVSLLTSRNGCQQIRIPELDGQLVLDAKYDSGVLMLVTRGGGRSPTAARLDRYVVRFSDDFSDYDVRCVADVGQSDINFVTLDTGVCVCLTAGERLEVMAPKPGTRALKYVDDRALDGDMILARQHERLLFFRRRKVYQMTLRPARRQRLAAAEP